MKIISGGQTGADRGGLDGARDAGVEIGGWCPKGRRADDGKIPDEYPLQETPQPAYLQRTEWNIRDAGLTLICHQGEMGPGTKATIKLAKSMRKTAMEVDLRDRDSKNAAYEMLVYHPTIVVVNIAGPREIISPGVQEKTREFVRILCKKILEARSKA